MIPTHVTTHDGGLEITLNDSMRTVPEQLRFYLDRLDGSDRFALGLWKLPEGTHLGDREADVASGRAYIQAAGSAPAMTIEIKKTIDGISHQYAIGHAVDASTVITDVAIPYNDGNSEVVVRSNEVFEAAEAAVLYVSYYETGDIPAGYVLRELDMRIGKSGTRHVAV